MSKRFLRPAGVAALVCLPLAGLSVGASAAETATATELASLKARIEQLEAKEKASERALESEALSEREPELVTRVKALEMDVRDSKPALKKVGTWDGVEGAASLLYVSQHIDAGSAQGQGDGQYGNYRFDGSLQLPAGDWRRGSGFFFVHARAGQSPALSELPRSFSGLNASAFQLGGSSQPEDAALTLTEAWYQLDYPLGRPLDGSLPGSKATHVLSFNIGKIDPFLFFDQNAYANDEAAQFLAAPFVHNALLDNPLAAQIGTDAYGASPGLHLAYDYRSGPESVGLSYGQFASGEDATYGSAMDQTLELVQVHWQTRFWGLAGNYRLIWFANDAGPSFLADEVDASTGVLASFDQQLGADLAAFLRYGQANGEQLPFDRSLALGVEVNAGLWARAYDRLGLGVAQMRSSAEFRAQAADLTDFAYAPGQHERLFESYYRYVVNEHMHLSLHWQRLANAGADTDADADAVQVWSLRWQWNY